MTLDEVEKLFLGFEVVIKTGKGHSATTGEVAHAGAFVPLFVENVGGNVEDFSKTAVEAGVGRGR